jgi:O-antigen/teichoic acid export membrane protein
LKHLKLARLITPARLASARAALTYFSTSVINALLPLALLPILTTKLTPADYGLVALFQSVQAVANVLIHFAMGGTLMRALTVGTEEDRADYAASALSIVAISFSAVAVIGFIGTSIAGEVAGLSTLWIMAAIASGGFMAVNQLHLVSLQAQVKALRYSIMQIATALTNAGLTLIFVVALNAGWEGRALAILLSYLMSSTVGLLLMVREGHIGRPKLALMKDAVQLGGAAMPHAILNSIMSVGDRFLLSFFFSNSVVGVYAVALQLASGIMFIGSALHGALQPVGLRMLSQMRSWEERRRLGKIALAFNCLVVVSASIYITGIILFKNVLVHEEFFGFTSYFYVLSVASIFQSIYFIYSYPLFYYRAMRVLAMTGVSLFVVFTMVSLGGIYLFGSIGVSFGIFAARLGLLSTAIFFSVRLTARHVRTIEQNSGT